MRTQNAKNILLLLCLAVCAGMCRSDVLEDAKSTAGDIKDGAVTVAGEAAEKSESFAQWAYDKLSE